MYIFIYVYMRIIYVYVYIRICLYTFTSKTRRARYAKFFTIFFNQFCMYILTFTLVFLCLIQLLVATQNKFIFTYVLRFSGQLIVQLLLLSYCVAYLYCFFCFAVF